MATNIKNATIIAEKLDYDGTANVFETDQAITDTATLTIDVSCNLSGKIIPSRFWVDEVRYYMDQTNAVTYTLYLLEGPTADDVTQHSDVFFESPAAQADVTEYVWRPGGLGTFPNLATADNTLPCIVDLHTSGKIYYILDWSGAPGDTPGYIKIKGRLLK